MAVLPPATFYEIKEQKPLTSSASKEFTAMLHEVGLLRSDIYCTNSCKTMTGHDKELFAVWQPNKGVFIPTDAFEKEIALLKEEIERVQPDLILACGSIALFALTGEMSVAKWRASLLPYNNTKCAILPIFSPQEILRQWSWRWYTIHDLRRGVRFLEEGWREPDWHFHLRPSFSDAKDFLFSIKDKLDAGPTFISHDIETVANHIDCAGISTDEREAMCIPLMSKDNAAGYWSLEEEATLVQLHRDILTHENAQVIGQNYAYDSQYIARYWGFLPQLRFDTQIAWHVLFPGERKSLDILASLLCDHYLYWKDDLKQHRAHPEDETNLWKYNCVDVVYTFEIAMKQRKLLEAANLGAQYDERMAHARNVLNTMLRGIRINHKVRGELHMQLLETQARYEERLQYLIPHEGKGSPWYRSPKRFQEVLYEELGLPVQRHKKTKQPTCDDKALDRLASKEPILRPILQSLQEYRSVKVFVSTFLDMRLDADGRARSSLNMAGPETFRLSASKDVFGFGLNLQTIPKGTEF